VSEPKAVVDRRRPIAAGRVWLFGPAILAAGASVHAEGREATSTLSFGTGWFDVAEKRDPEPEPRLEYRVGRASRSLRGIVVAAMTRDSSAFLGAGIGYELRLGRHFVVTPTFTPGYYGKGNGKDLGYALEFRSQLELGCQLGGGYRLSLAVSHTSNARLGKFNPGEETLTLAWQVPLTRRRVP